MARSTLVFFVFCVALCISNTIAEEGKACKTPNGESAKCVSIYSCKPLLDAVRTKDTNVINFLRESQCGYNVSPLVCCGTAITYTTNTVQPESIKVVRNSSVNLPSRNAASTKAIASKQECGFMASEDKLLSGRITEIDEFPWMTLLEYRVKASGRHTFLCGGSLVGPRYVITAAHCVVGKIKEKYSLSNVRLGEWNVETAEDCVTVANEKDCSEPPVNMDIEEIVVHPGYDDSSIHRQHDIAVIRLKECVNYTDFIRPICLPTPKDEAAVGDRLYIAGWGKTENSTFSNVKLKLRIPKTSTAECRSIFSRANIHLGDGQICAGAEYNKDSCTGDSGGPLMAVMKDNPIQWYMEGLVSFGTTCGTEGWPGVYTKVSKYLDWIKSSVRD